jgi:phenylacetate-CoA ligase
MVFMIPLHNSLYKYWFTFQLVKKNRFEFFKILNELKKSQYYSTEELKDIQLRKLRLLIKYSYDNVPYYHELFKKNSLHPSDINKLEDLQKIPILTKKMIRANLNKMISTQKNISDLFKNYTSGSTGNPINFYQCQNFLVYADAGRIFGWYIFPGFDLGTRTAILWGADSDIRTSQSFAYQLGKYLNGTIKMNSNITNDIKFEHFINKIYKFKPFILRGYPSILYEFAKYIDKNNMEISGLKSVISSAEVLYEHQRKKLEEIFQCHIFNSYGCREVSKIAMECTKHNGLHILMDNQIVEILDTDEEVTENEVGDVIITNLNNFGMPFIRYKVGDKARRSSIRKCECKRGLSLIDGIIGREQGHIKIPSGSIISEAYFGIKLSKVPGIEEYQIIQERIDNIIILIVGDPGASRDKLSMIKNQMMKEIGENVEIEIKYTDKLMKSKAGKYLMVISKI